jgi:hypothetical protein
MEKEKKMQTFDTKVSKTLNNRHERVVSPDRWKICHSRQSLAFPDHNMMEVGDREQTKSGRCSELNNQNGQKMLKRKWRAEGHTWRTLEFCTVFFRY